MHFNIADADTPSIVLSVSLSCVTCPSLQVFRCMVEQILEKYVSFTLLLFIHMESVEFPTLGLCKTTAGFGIGCCLLSSAKSTH